MTQGTVGVDLIYVRFLSQGALYQGVSREGHDPTVGRVRKVSISRDSGQVVSCVWSITGPVGSP